MGGGDSDAACVVSVGSLGKKEGGEGECAQEETGSEKNGPAATIRSESCMARGADSSTPLATSTHSHCAGGAAYSNYAVGYNNVKVPEATKRGIPVGNTPGGWRVACVWRWCGVRCLVTRCSCGLVVMV